MRLAKRALLSGICLLAMTATAAAQCPSPLTGGVATPNEAQPFRQERHLKGASRPIVSSGLVSVDDGVVVWRVTTPIEIVTRIADDGVTQSIDGGEFERVGETAGAGFSSQIGFTALLRADMTALEVSYSIKDASPETAGNWAFALSPRNDQLAEQVTAIDVEGCKALTGVRVRQANGDMIVIRFTESAG